MLRGGKGDLGTGIGGLYFEHHLSTASLRQSRDEGCSICVGLVKEMDREIDITVDQKISIEASLRTLRESELGDAYKNPAASLLLEHPFKRNPQNGFRLDFDLHKRPLRSFLLKPTSTPLSLYDSALT